MPHFPTRRLLTVGKTVLRHVSFCVVATSHNNGIGGDLDGAVVVSMVEGEGTLLGKGAVRTDQLSALGISTSDKENCITSCCTAVLSPLFQSRLQMLPISTLVDLAGIIVAGNEAS